MIGESEERDLIDQLIDDLNDGVIGVTFDRDVLDTDRPDDWGAVELTGAVEEWADGMMIDQETSVDVWVCVSEKGTRIKRQVQKVLNAFAKAHDAGWKFVRRAYLYDLDKVMWQWTVSICGPLGGEPEEEEDEDELPFTDPEEDPEESQEEDPEWPEIDQDGDD